MNITLNNVSIDISDSASSKDVDAAISALYKKKIEIVFDEFDKSEKAIPRRLMNDIFDGFVIKNSGESK